MAFCQEQAFGSVAQRVCFFVVVCSHLEQAFGPVPQRVSLIVGWVGDPVPVGVQKRGFFTKYFVTHGKFGKKPGFFVGVRPGLFKSR